MCKLTYMYATFEAQAYYYLNNDCFNLYLFLFLIERELLFK